MNDHLLAADEVALPPAGLFVTVATTLFARTGEWPWWFLRVVGADVPEVYLLMALRQRRDLEQDLGIGLPIFHASHGTESAPPHERTRDGRSCRPRKVGHEHG